MSLPRLTGDLPGTGGTLRAEVEDFVVDEIPAYEPSGAGDFLYLWVEKRDMGAEFFAKQVAQRLGIRPDDVGMAGLKDRRAVTRQWISVPAGVEPRLPQLEGDGIVVLKTGRHGNKLRPGHLHGNRFVIRVRDTATPRHAAAVVQRLREKGLPNYYGEQRFGRDGETLALGLQLLRGEATDPRGGKKFLRKLALSAVQSALFNDYLARRLTDGLLHTVLSGDAMAKWPFGGMFTAEDVAAEQARFDRREIVSAGPMFGTKLFPAKGAAVEREAAVLRDNGLSPSSFAGFGKLLLGTRRHNLVYVDDLEASAEGNDVLLRFTLPAGSYATVLLEEVMKN
jgi:tRNA pseudouridine13 synthase